MRLVDLVERFNVAHHPTLHKDTQEGRCYKSIASGSARPLPRTPNSIARLRQYFYYGFDVEGNDAGNAGDSPHVFLSFAEKN